MVQKHLSGITPLVQSRFKAARLMDSFDELLDKYFEYRHFPEDYKDHLKNTAYSVYRITGSEALYVRAALMDERDRGKIRLLEFMNSSKVPSDSKIYEQLKLLIVTAQFGRLNILTELDRSYENALLTNPTHHTQTHNSYLQRYEFAMCGLHGDDIIRAVAIADILSYIDPFNNDTDPFKHLYKLFEDAGKSLGEGNTINSGTPYSYKQPILRIYRPMAQRSAYFYDRFREVTKHRLVEDLGRALAFISDPDSYLKIMNIIARHQTGFEQVKNELQKIFNAENNERMSQARRLLKNPQNGIALNIKSPTSIILKLKYDEDVKKRIEEQGFDPTSPEHFFVLMTDLVRFRGDLRDDVTEQDIKFFLNLLKQEILDHTGGGVAEYDYPDRGIHPIVKGINLSDQIDRKLNLGFVSLQARRLVSGLKYPFIVEGQARLSKDIAELEDGKACHEKKDAIRYGGPNTETISGGLLRRMGMRAQIMSILDNQSNIPSENSLISVPICLCVNGNEFKRVISLYNGSIIADAVAATTNDVLRPHNIIINGKKVGLNLPIRPNQEIRIIVSDGEPNISIGPQLLLKVHTVAAQAQIAADLYVPSPDEQSGTYRRISKSKPPGR